MDYHAIIEMAQNVQAQFAPFTHRLDEGSPLSEEAWLDESEDNPYGGSSVFKMKLIYQGFNPKLKGTTAKGTSSDKYWEVKVRKDGSVMRKWGATGGKAHLKVDKKANAKAGVAHAKSMASKKKAKGYKEVSSGSSKAKSKVPGPHYK